MSTEQEQREQVVAEARTWVGTPWHHQGRLKGAGVDCAMILIEVYSAAGLISPQETPEYAQQWFMHRNEPRFLQELEKHARKVSEPTGPGDIVVFRVARQHAHGAIVTGTDPLTFLHAYMRAGIVLEGREEEFPDLAGADRVFYSPWQ